MCFFTAGFDLRVCSLLPRCQTDPRSSGMLRGEDCQNSLWTAWPSKMGPASCPETSVTNYQSTSCNNPEERKSRVSIPPSSGCNDMISGTHKRGFFLQIDKLQKKTFLNRLAYQIWSKLQWIWILKYFRHVVNYEMATEYSVVHPCWPHLAPQCYAYRYEAVARSRWPRPFRRHYMIFFKDTWQEVHATHRMRCESLLYHFKDWSWMCNRLEGTILNTDKQTNEKLFGVLSFLRS